MAMQRFKFKTEDEFEDARLTLHLASLAVQGMYGEARVRLETATFFDRQLRTVGVDDTGLVGESLVRSYTKFLLEEFGPDGFEVTTPSGSEDEPSEARHG
ncbi:MAG TPA: hypothetical protein PK093_09920 [Phycisphaerae bacterium]|nr:hypothetical protein [Phycisphaerae bacterium]